MALPGWVGLSVSAFPRRYSLFPGIFAYFKKYSPLPNLPFGCYAHVGTPWVGWAERFGVPTSISVVSREYSPISEDIRPSQIFHSGASHMLGLPLVGWAERFGVPTSISVVFREYSPFSENIRPSQIFHSGATHMLALSGLVGLSISAFPRRYSLFPDNIRLSGEILVSPKSSTWVLCACGHSLGWLG